MNSVKLKTHTDSTGKIKIETPTEIKDSDIEAVVIYERFQNKNEYNEWFTKLNNLYGSTKDTPLKEPEELPYVHYFSLVYRFN